jgi:hypothetical protein
MIVVGEVTERKSSKHNGRFVLNSRSPFSPYRLFKNKLRFYDEKKTQTFFPLLYYLISHKVLLITIRSGFSESFLNSSNIRNVTSFRHL